MFQSLFLWIFRSYLLSKVQISLSAKSVSILVLMDLSFLQNVRTDVKANHQRVSILVLMDLSFLQSILDELMKNTFKVSILVLMDLSFLQDATAKTKPIALMCFNPCSYGSFVLTF